MAVFITLIVVLLGCKGEKNNVSVLSKSAPNIVFVLVDDLRWDEFGLGGHNYIQTPNIDKLAEKAVVFKNAFATTPLCSPSRASFLTGKYAFAHGILDNTDRSILSHQLQTFPAKLQQEGYETAFIGKWHMGNDNTPRLGFNKWVALKGQGKAIDPEFNVDGSESHREGYVTDILTAYALEFINEKRNKPFYYTFHIRAYIQIFIKMLQAWSPILEKVVLSLPSGIRVNTKMLFLIDDQMPSLLLKISLH